MPGVPPTPERIRWTVELLGVRPTDDVLEVGCGVGQAVALVAARLTRGGSLLAIDRSATMVARAQTRNAAALRSGNVRIVRQTLAAAAKSGGTFGKVFAVNVNAFWTTPASSLAALARLVAPAGSVYLVYEPPSQARLRQLQGEVPAALTAAGFQLTDLRVHDTAHRLLLAVIASSKALGGTRAT